MRYCDFTYVDARKRLGLRVEEARDLYRDVPVVMVEAEENLVGGLGQCLAEMVAARDFNAREGTARDVVYGAVTTGTARKFLELRGDEAAIDLPEYHIGRAGKVLGVLLQMVA